MKNLAVIPARKGSKRIPKKNIRYLFNKPLIAYSIEHALHCKSINDIVVSTNIDEVEAIVKGYSDSRLKIFWRDKALGGDFISTEDVLINVLKKIECKEDISSVVTLLPTSPFRNPESIERCIELFYKKNADSVSTINEAQLKIGSFNLKTSEFSLLDPETPAEMHKVKPTFYDNPAIYVTKPSVLLKDKFILGAKNYGLMLDSIEGFDINTEKEWLLAEFIAQRKLYN
jgi:CMP-N-acetylneuraminic acid synthetase